MTKNYNLRFTALVPLLMLAGIVIAATPANATANSVCLAGADNELQCAYTSLEQCRAAASGGVGYCTPAFPTRPDEAYNGRHHH